MHAITTKYRLVRRALPVVPVLCTFGPLEMVLGFDTPFHLVALIASLLTSIGILIIFANVMSLVQDRDGNVVQPAGGANAQGVMLVAAMGVVLIAACTALLFLAAK